MYASISSLSSSSIFFLLIIPVVIGLADQWRNNKTEGLQKWLEAENLPSVLRRSTLYMNEQTISMYKPVQINGVVDQVYLKNGRLYIVDTKTRGRHVVYPTDIYQISLYAMILSVQYGERVCGTGYIRTVVRESQSRSVRYHPVRLISPRVLLGQLRMTNGDT